jgi:predicted DCC family thiol-disulfide oxidoreductase YuxK
MRKTSARQWNARWWDYVRKFQGIEPPAARGEEFCDAATKTHINDTRPIIIPTPSPRVLKFQLHDHIRGENSPAAPATLQLRRNKQVGAFLRRHHGRKAAPRTGAKCSARTGENLSTRAMVEYYKPLLAWLQDRTAGGPSGGSDFGDLGVGEFGKPSMERQIPKLLNPKLFLDLCLYCSVISVTTEMKNLSSVTDERGISPVRAWVGYDGDCGVCRGGVRRLAQGVRCAGDSSSCRANRLAARPPSGWGEGAPDEEMKLLFADGRIAGGIDAIAAHVPRGLVLAPSGRLVSFPGLIQLARLAYRALARRRHRFGACKVPAPATPHRPRSAFLDPP